MKKPNFYIFAGINGAGKTTLYYNELELGNTFGYRINIDEIVSSFGDWKNQKDQTRASKIAIKLRNNYLKNNQSFNLETTFSGKTILNAIKIAKNKGYNIILYYVGLDSAELAKDRVAQRMLKGGHFVDNKTIDRRYPKSLQNLKKSLDFVDNAFIFDNTNGFKKIAIKQKDKLHILEKMKWFH